MPIARERGGDLSKEIPLKSNNYVEEEEEKKMESNQIKKEKIFTK